jgi:hypothetical protein
LGLPSLEQEFLSWEFEGMQDFRLRFPTPKYGQSDKKPFRSMSDVIGGMEEWPADEYFDFIFHGHYLARNRKRDWNDLKFTIVRMLIMFHCIQWAVL